MADQTDVMFEAFRQLWVEYPSFKDLLKHVQDTHTIVINWGDEGGKTTLSEDTRQLLIDACLPYSNFDYSKDSKDKLYFPNDQPHFDNVLGREGIEYFDITNDDRNNYPEPQKQSKIIQSKSQEDERKDDENRQVLNKHNLYKSINTPACLCNGHKRPETGALPRFMDQKEFFEKIQFLDTVFQLPRNRFMTAQCASGITLELAGGNGASSLLYFAYNPNITKVLMTDAQPDSIKDGSQRLTKLLSTKGYSGIKDIITIDVPTLILHDNTQESKKVNIEYFHFDLTPELLPTILSKRAPPKPRPSASTGQLTNSMTSSSTELPYQAYWEIPEGIEKGPLVPKNKDIFLFAATVDQVGCIVEELNKVHPLHSSKLYHDTIRKLQTKDKEDVKANGEQKIHKTQSTKKDRKNQAKNVDIQPLGKHVHETVSDEYDLTDVNIVQNTTDNNDDITDKDILNKKITTEDHHIEEELNKDLENQRNPHQIVDTVFEMLAIANVDQITFDHKNSIFNSAPQESHPVTKFTSSSANASSSSSSSDKNHQESNVQITLPLDTNKELGNMAPMDLGLDRDGHHPDQKGQDHPPTPTFDIQSFLDAPSGPISPLAPQ